MLLAPPLCSHLDPGAPAFQDNRAAMLERLEEFDRLLDEAGGGAAHHARLTTRGKLPVRQRIALALDPDSPFLELSPLAAYNSSCTIGGGAVMGIGILDNDGVLDPESAQKGAQFIQLCSQIDMPLLFLQNLTGFVVGRDVERAGIIKKSSQPIDAVTNSTVPHFTVIIGASYGAGTYAMSGRAFDNRFPFLWPTARIAVMAGKQIVGMMAIVRRAQTIHPGYGFLVENAGLASAVIQSGLTWVGPLPEAIAHTGDKLAAKTLIREVGVPTLASSEDGVVADLCVGVGMQVENGALTLRVETAEEAS